MTHIKWLEILITAFKQETGFKETPYDTVLLSPLAIDANDPPHAQFEAWLASKSVDSLTELYRNTIN